MRCLPQDWICGLATRRAALEQTALLRRQQCARALPYSEACSCFWLQKLTRERTCRQRTPTFLSKSKCSRRSADVMTASSTCLSANSRWHRQAFRCRHRMTRQNFSTARIRRCPHPRHHSALPTQRNKWLSLRNQAIHAPSGTILSSSRAHPVTSSHPASVILPAHPRPRSPQSPSVSRNPRGKRICGCGRRWVFLGARCSKRM